MLSPFCYPNSKTGLRLQSGGSRILPLTALPRIYDGAFLSNCACDEFFHSRNNFPIPADSTLSFYRSVRCCRTLLCTARAPLDREVPRLPDCVPELCPGK